MLTEWNFGLGLDKRDLTQFFEGFQLKNINYERQALVKQNINMLQTPV